MALAKINKNRGAKMNTLAERVKFAREKANLTQIEVSELVGMSQPSFQKIESGGTKRTTYIQELAQVLGVNPHWLATGQGDMNSIIIGGDNANSGSQNTSTQTTTTTNNYYGVQNVSPNFEPISDWDSDTPLEADELEIPFYKDFGVACGHGSDGVAYQSEKRRLRISRATLKRIGSSRDKVFATLADGDSMSPTINDGATIWVDTSKDNIKDGKIFVFEYGGLFMCKRLYRLLHNGLRVVSDNDIDYPPFEITGEERNKNGFRLIGWVWHWSVMERW